MDTTPVSPGERKVDRVGVTAALIFTLITLSVAQYLPPQPRTITWPFMTVFVVWPLASALMKKSALEKFDDCRFAIECAGIAWLLSLA